jgi:mono/diheme cytochrome c family protein
MVGSAAAAPGEAGHRGTIEGDGSVRRATACALLLVLALGAGASGCGSDTSEDDAAAAARQRAAAAQARSVALGRRAFEEHCHTCHTIGGERHTRPIIEFLAPNLDEVRLKRRYVQSRVDVGGPAMASFSGTLSRAEYEGVIDYVMETAGRNVVDDGQQPADELAAGRQVFAQQCAACHAIEGRAATGRPIYPGTDFTLVKPSPRWVLRRMHEGVLPEHDMMPSFRGKLTDAEMRAVATYVSAVGMEGPEAPPR